MVNLDVIKGIRPMRIILIQQANLTQVSITLPYLLPFALPTTCVSKLDRLGILFVSPDLARSGIEIMEFATL